jgi:outer membrane protein assembly factor BamB
VDPADGAVLWSVPNTTRVTPVIAGDTLVTAHRVRKTSLRAYTLSPADAVLRWSAMLPDRGASPVTDGRVVYAVGGKPKTKLACFDLADGTLKWEQPFGTSEYSSPILAGDTLLAVRDNGRTLVLAHVSPEGYQELAAAPLPITRFTSPALADGKLYLRQTDGVACYDVTAERNAHNYWRHANR